MWRCWESELGTFQTDFPVKAAGLSAFYPKCHRATHISSWSPNLFENTPSIYIIYEIFWSASPYRWQQVQNSCVLKLLTQKWHPPMTILPFQCHFDSIWCFPYFSSISQMQQQCFWAHFLSRIFLQYENLVIGVRRVFPFHLASEVKL